jgi:hypothetical protein
MWSGIPLVTEFSVTLGRVGLMGCAGSRTRPRGDFPQRAGHDRVRRQDDAKVRLPHGIRWTRRGCALPAASAAAVSARGPRERRGDTIGDPGNAPAPCERRVSERACPRDVALRSPLVRSPASCAACKHIQHAERGMCRRRQKSLRSAVLTPRRPDAVSYRGARPH